MLKIASLNWQTLGLLMVLRKHPVPWESGLSNAKTMKRLDGAKGRADGEISAGVCSEASSPGGLMEHIEDGVGALPALPLTPIKHII